MSDSKKFAKWLEDYRYHCPKCGNPCALPPDIDISLDNENDSKMNSFVCPHPNCGDIYKVKNSSLISLFKMAN